MLTRLKVRNFKRFGDVKVELGSPVVFIGPNDSGKTTALQALALWDTGIKRWTEKRAGKPTPEKRPGVTINRRDLIAVPVPDAKLLWKGLSVRNVERTEKGQATENVRIDIIVEGVSEGRAWECGLEFDYANPESIYCRPVRLSGDGDSDRMPVPPEAGTVNIAFLPPMSGLAATEDRLDRGSINVRLGEGRTAEVLRNLCYQIFTSENGGRNRWRRVCDRIESLFGARLADPDYVAERGEITLAYTDAGGSELDLSSSGRGMQQTLLLLSYLTVNQGSVLLLDEPDAHLEIIRQRQIYDVLVKEAQANRSQIIAASHSEVILNEAADRDVVVAFVGLPHRIDDRGSQLLKSLKHIGFEHYFQAEQTGWVLYLEGSTDLAILRAFAELLEHPAVAELSRPFVDYVENRPSKTYEHFYGIREAKPDLVGFSLFDRLEPRLGDEAKPGLTQYVWQRREIENYLCTRQTLMRWSSSTASTLQGELFATSWTDAMDESITEIEEAMHTLGKGSPWGSDAKVSDDFLNPLFERFFEKLDLPNLMEKSDYHRLAQYVSPEELDPEIKQVLDLIHDVASRARPRG